ncbi:hypothetical protein BGW41_003705 [Actinomortierella wolfii]|nr:hypothetical protein BGW41_003705 [Actinomortierella wolfii]
MEQDEPYDFNTWHSNVPAVKDEKKEKKKLKKEAAKAEKKSKKGGVKDKKDKKSKKSKRKDESDDDDDSDQQDKEAKAIAAQDSDSDSDSSSGSSSDSDIDSNNDDPNTMPPPKSKKKKIRKNKKKKADDNNGSDDDEAQAPENEDDESGDKKKKKKKSKEGPGRKGEFGIWIGNLSFLTTDKALRHFFKDVGAEITRVNLPKGRDGRNKGFAYIDFSSQEGQENAIALSEKELDGRRVLIKSSKSFAGRPMVSKTEVTEQSFKQKHAESPTLFVGNLSFNTTRESLKALFEDAGEIRKVRLATFEDSGKCKGFAYIDYTETESATKALRDPKKHFLDGRKLKVEYASADATLRGNPRLYRKHLREKEGAANGEGGEAAAAGEEGDGAGGEESTRKKRSASDNPDEQRAKRQRRPRGEPAPKKLQGHQRPGFALAMAQRASQGIQEFKGTKVTFGDD